PPVIYTLSLHDALPILMELGYDPGLRLSPRQEKSFLRSGYELSFGLNSDRNLVELQWQIVPLFCSINFDMDALFSRSMQIDLDRSEEHTSELQSRSDLV